ncbi:MAG: glycosyltransferase family 4 protein [Bacteroidetes bacterium]|nr:glycosyltransferase family 4 protein [Bacteroidota bacterium]
MVDQGKLTSKTCHSHVDPWFIQLCSQARDQGAKWIHTYHTLYFEEDWDNGLAEWQKEYNRNLLEVAKNADVRISVSQWLQKHLRENYSIDSIYIPNGVDVCICDKADGRRFFKKFPLKDFILFASGISDIKNPIDFIRLAQSIPEKQFVMIGRQLSIDALVEKYGIELPLNLMVIGQMPHEELLDAIAACRVFVITSRSEGLPTAVMEAMALERPVVGSNRFGISEVIHSDEYGYLYNFGSLADLKEKTLEAWNDTEIGKRARKRVLENYDWNVVIPQIDLIYKKIIS